MKTTIKSLNVEMEIKNKGMEIEVRDTGDNFQGDLVINKSGITWCKGRTTPSKGKKKSWEEVIALFES